MNLETAWLRGNQVIDGKMMRDDGRLVGSKGWKEKVHNRGMEEAPENVKESLDSVHANGMNEFKKLFYLWYLCSLSINQHQNRPDADVLMFPIVIQP